MPKKMPTPKRCPFCGTIPNMWHWAAGSDYENYEVSCSDSRCHTTKIGKTQRAAINRWNTRYEESLIENCVKKIITGKKKNAEIINRIRPFKDANNG